MALEAMRLFPIAGFTLVSAKIINIGTDGMLTVKTDDGDLTLTCRFVRTSKGPVPSLHLRSEVLCAMDESRKNGYVLGLIENYAAPEEVPDSLPFDSNQDIVPHLNVRAEDEIVLSCGQSEIIMQKNGKVVIKGIRVTTRAKESNRIKGATVQIN